MRIIHTARRCEVPNPVLDRAEELVRKLKKYNVRLSGAELVFETEKHRHLVEGILSVDGSEPVVATGEGEDFRAAVDEMIERLSRRLRRLRSQRRDHQALPPHRAAELASD